MSRTKQKRQCAFFAAIALLCASLLPLRAQASDQAYIKWVDFTVSAPVLRDTLSVDLASQESGAPISWIDLIAALGQKYGGNFSYYRKKDLEAFAEAARTGCLEEKVQNKKLFHYYQEAYGAILSGMVGHYTEERRDESGSVITEKKYGLKAFHPLAAGYSYSHSDDFGNTRDYGYKRRHLGHDMFGSVGTPVVAIESGYVEALGWNQYGGWRIGIRSFDGQRYYYYAHLRKDHPFADLYEGKIVRGGEVIGYLGMTGYSAKENVNNIKTPHLHVGLEVIFDPSQKDGYNQIWISMYELVNFLKDNRVRAYREGNESVSHLCVIDEEMPD
jgi:murein DD-endopeptidase MepM/ murein hydrolase activator NlpD